MMSSQRSDTEKINLIEEGKKIGIDEVVRCNKIINNSLKSQIETNVILLLKVQKEYRKHKSKSFKNYILMVTTINGKTMILSKVAIWGSKKSNFIKELEAKELLSNWVLEHL